jgi:hypothetical protein
MASRRGPGKALLLALLAVSCGRSAHDLSVASDPLLTLHGHVDVAKLTRFDPSKPLIGALVWGSIPRINPLCLKFQDPQLQAACPDPYGFFYGELELAAPVDGNGDFALPIFHLPKASVSVGDAVTRIAYGSLVVAEDTNGDGQLSFPVSQGGGGGGGGPGDPNPPTPPPPDVIIGAAFSTLLADQVRVVFREGGFVEGSNFYPDPGCPTPPGGFSTLSVPAYTGDPAAPGTCLSHPPDTTIEVLPLKAAEALGLMCRPLQQGIGVQQPNEQRKPRPTQVPVCLSHEIVALVTPSICNTFVAYGLKGCRLDPFCDKPDWDVTKTPPTWWPCP